jgi:hypothetical protein
MYDVSEESDTGHEALPPQSNWNRAIHNEIRGGILGGHVFAKATVEFQASKSGRG